EESRPSHDIDVDTVLVRRPKLGHERRALARQQRERLRLLCDGSRNRSTHVAAHVIDLAADQVVGDGAATPIGNVSYLDADPRVEQRTSKMRGRSDACRAVLHLRAVLFKQRDKLCEVVGSQILAAFEYHRLVRKESDRGK